MALMKRSNPKVIRSTLGHSVYFPGDDIPVFVPTILQSAALEAGAQFVEDTAKKQYDVVQDEVSDLRKEEGPTNPADRAIAILEGVTRLARANRSGDFTAAGLPKTQVLSKLLNFRVDVTEVRTAWESYTQAPFKED